MSVVSHLAIRIAPGRRRAALDAFRTRRVFEECADAIPGFAGAFLLADRNDPDTIIVIAEWRDAADYATWTRHPVCAAQKSDLAHFLAAAPETRLFDKHA